MATHSTPEIAEVMPSGSQRASGTGTEESEREEPGLPAMESAMDSPRTHRAPMPLPRPAVTTDHERGSSEDRRAGFSQDDIGPSEREESDREEPQNVGPRPPMPLPVGGRRTKSHGRSGQSNIAPRGRGHGWSNTGASRSSTGGTYQHMPGDSDSDTHHNRPRDYGAVDQQLSGGHGLDDSHSQQGEAADYVEPLVFLNRRDKLFGMNMKKYILSSLGMLNIPGTRVSCTWIAVLFYLFLAAWGVGILTMATQTVFTSLKEKDCRKMIPSFVLAMLGGLFFILLGLYWMLVFWWIKTSRSGSVPRKVGFSLPTILWLILALFFVGTAAALATEVYEHSHVIANLKGGVSCNGVDMNVTMDAMIMEDSKVPYHYNIIPILALGSMVVLWLVYVCVFLLHAVCPKK